MLQSVESNGSELETAFDSEFNPQRKVDIKTSVVTTTEDGDYDETTRIAIYLFNCAKKFLSPTSTSPQVLPAIKCLYMALSMVLAPQFEVELRLMLGNVLLDQTQNFNEALEQIQKANQLAESSLGAIKFEEKCRISRSLIDALIRTNSVQLAQSILETICIQALQVQTPTAWQWFLQFSLMNLQSKLDNKLLLHQALSDTDEILKIIQNHQLIFDSDEEWKYLLASSKVLVLSFLLMILTDDRKILSVFSIIPKAIEELSHALTELNCFIYYSDSDLNFKSSVVCLSTAFFGESLILLNSLAFSNSQQISNGIENLLNLFKFVNEKNIQISELQLPGHLTFLNFEEFRLLGDFITLLTLRQSPSVTFINLQNEIERLTGNIKNNNNIINNKPSTNSNFLNNLLMALNSFKSCLDLESGLINQSNSSKSPIIGDLEFNKKFREFLLSFTAHAVVKRLGVPKVTALYDHKIKSTLEVDLKNLLILNRSLLTSDNNSNNSSSERNEIEKQTQNLQIVTNSVSFYLIRAIELQNLNSPAHHIRNCLSSAEELIKNQFYHEPKLECILNILLGEFHFKTDLELSRNYLQSAFNTAQHQLSNKFLMNLAGKNLVKSFLMTGDELIASKWTEFLNALK